MMSMFALGTITAFAGNGEREIALEKFNDLTVENQSNDSKDFFNHTANYVLSARIFICGPGNVGTDYFVTATGPNGTGCVDATQLASLITLYENMYAITHPGACNVIIYSDKIDDCIH